MSGQLDRPTLRSAGKRRVVRLEEGIGGSLECGTSSKRVRPGIELVLQRCRRLVETLEDGILWQADEQGMRVEFVGAHVEQRLGYPAGYWLLNPGFWPERLHAADRGRVEAMVRHALAHGTELVCEHRFVGADGTAHWFESGLRVATPRDGRPAVARGFSTEIPDLETARRGDRARARHSGAIAQIARCARGTPDPRVLVETALCVATTALGVDFGEVLELLPDGETLRVRASVGLAGDAPARGTLLAPPGSELGEALRTGRAMVEDRAADPAFSRRGLLEAHGALAGLSVAIHGSRGPCGVIALHSRTRRAFTPEEAQFLRVAGDLIAAAVERTNPAAVAHECHELLQDLRDAAGDAVLVKDSRGRYALVNDAAARLLGRPVEEILGRDDAEILPPYAARARAESDRALLRARRDAVAQSGGELGASGHAYLAARGAVRDRAGSVTGLVEVLRELREPTRATPLGTRMADATGPRRAITAPPPEDASSAFARAPVALAAWRGADLRCALANRRHVQLLGPHDVSGVSPREAFAVLGRHELIEAFDRVLATGEPATVSEVHLPTGPAGRPLFLTFALEATRDADGEVTGVTSAALDVTDAVQARRRAESGPRPAAGAATRERGELLAVVSHELGSPLAAILLTTETILRGSLPEATVPLRKSVQAIQRCAERMIRLVADMRDVANLAAGRLTVVPRPCEVSALVDDAVTTMRVLVENASLRLTAPDGPRARVACDRERIGQVLCNLLGNAIKFTPSGGNIELRVEPRRNDVLFAVADTGRGLTQPQMSRVFEQYWQADDATRRGSGLGLFISRGIIEAHRGRIWVESAPGRGSTFLFTLPRVK